MRQGKRTGPGQRTEPSRPLVTRPGTSTAAFALLSLRHGRSLVRIGRIRPWAPKTAGDPEARSLEDEPTPRRLAIEAAGAEAALTTIADTTTTNTHRQGARPNRGLLLLALSCTLACADEPTPVPLGEFSLSRRPDRPVVESLDVPDNLPQDATLGLEVRTNIGERWDVPRQADSMAPGIDFIVEVQLTNRGGRSVVLPRVIGAVYNEDTPHRARPEGHGPLTLAPGERTLLGWSVDALAPARTRFRLCFSSETELRKILDVPLHFDFSSHSPLSAPPSDEHVFFGGPFLIERRVVHLAASP